MFTLRDVNLPDDKAVWVSLRRLSGLGASRSQYITHLLGFSQTYKMGFMSKYHFELVSFLVKNFYMVELALRRRIISNLRRICSLRSYRGVRYISGLPLRGQGTRSNGNTAGRLHFKRG